MCCMIDDTLFRQSSRLGMKAKIVFRDVNTVRLYGKYGLRATPAEHSLYSRVGAESKSGKKWLFFF